jgi:hypothetical protein
MVMVSSRAWNISRLSSIALAPIGAGCLRSMVSLSQEVFSDTRRGLIEEARIGYVATASRQESSYVIEGQPKQEEKEKFGGRYIRVSLRAGGTGNHLAEAQKLLPFGYSSIYGESLEGFGRAEEGKVPTHLEAIANLKDMLAYCHVWGRMIFDIGEEDDEARELVEALDK